MIYRGVLICIWLGLIAATAMLSWPKQHIAGEVTPNDPLRYQILALQVKLSVGAHEFAVRSANKSDSGKAILSSLAAPLNDTLLPDPKLPSLYKVQYVLAHYFDLDTARNSLAEALRPSKELWDILVLQAYDKNAVVLTTAERDSLKQSLGEFGIFLNATPEALRSDHPEYVEAALNSLYKLIVGVSILGVLAILAFLSFVVFCYLLIRGKLRAKTVAQLQQPDRLLEAFCLYLAAMIVTTLYLLPAAAQIFQVNPLFLNIIAIPFLLLTLTWPLARGISFGQLLTALALRLGGIRRAFADFIVAPFAYLAGWVIIAAVLVVYAIVLQVMQIDPSSGAHPVVPMLLGGSDSHLVLAVALLAVLIAPIVEEIMFRGALYGWLRARLPAWSSVLISSACFAVMHPQGAIGLVPLGMIGILLAILREWRGSLLAPMVAHACFNGGTLIALLTLFR